MTVSNEEMQALVAAARLHADSSYADISNATTRVEHIRLSALAAEARRLADTLTLLSQRPEVDRNAEAE